MNSLNQFTQFLESVDLKKYRDLYRPIKIVEMDMPKDIQAIAPLYKIYWDNKEFVSFDEFYKKYLSEKKALIEVFRTKTMMCENCFYLGLPARIYRTWASLITQIHAGYVAESVFGEGSVNMSEELDHNGADFQVKYKEHILNYQIKKETFSREVRQEKKVKEAIPGKFIDLFYQVPSEDYFTEPLKKNGEYKLPYKRFIENTSLKRLPNGFVTFTKEAFEPEKQRIDSQK